MMTEEVSMRRNRLPSLLIMAAGLWLAVAPLLLGYAPFEAVAWHNAFIGLLVAALAAGRAFGTTGAWADWTIVALGAWMLLAPYMLRYEYAEFARTHDLVLGVLFVALALWDPFTLRMNERRRTRTFASAEPSDDELRSRNETPRF
jgi:hypothetical protein